MAKPFDITLKRNNDFIYNDSDRSILEYLYLPLIGRKAKNLYDLFIELTLNKGVVIEPIILLIDLMGDDYKNDEDLKERLRVLSAFKLIKVLSRNNFELYKPYSKDDFYSSNLFNLLLDNISNLEKEYIFNRFNFVEKENIKDKDITDLKYNTSKKRKEAFDFDKFKSYAKESDIIVKDEDKDMFMNLADIFSLSLDDALVALYEGVKEDNTYTKDDLIKVLYERFMRLDKKNKRKEELGSDTDEERIKKLSSMTPEELLEGESNNSKVKEEDKKIIDRLRSEFSMDDELITILLAYSLATKDREIRPYSFFEKIARDWAKKDIKNVSDAYYYITELYNKANNNDNKYYRNKGNKPIEDDWYDNYVKNYIEEMKKNG